MTLAFLLLFWFANALRGEAETDNGLLLASESYLQPLSMNPDSRFATFHLSTPKFVPNIIQILKKPSKKYNGPRFYSLRSGSDPSSSNTEMLVSAELPKRTVQSETSGRNENEQLSQKLSSSVILIPMPLEKTVEIVNNPLNIEEQLKSLDSILISNTPIANQHYQTVLDYDQEPRSRNVQKVIVDLSGKSQADAVSNDNALLDNTRTQNDILNKPVLPSLSKTNLNSLKNIPDILARLDKDKQNQKNDLKTTLTHLKTKNNENNILDDVNRRGWRTGDLNADNLENNAQLDQALSNLVDANRGNRWGFGTAGRTISTLDVTTQGQISPHDKVSSRVDQILHDATEKASNKKLRLNSELDENSVQMRRSGSELDSYNQYNRQLNNAVNNLMRVMDTNKYGRRSGDSSVKVTDDDIQNLVDAVNEIARVNNVAKRRMG